MKRRPALGARRAVALGFSGDDERAERAFFAARRARPVEPVVLSFGTGELLGKFVEPVAETILGGVVSLRLDISSADLDRIQLVPADAAIDDLLRASLDVEAPTHSLLDQWNWIRPLVLSQHDNRLLRALGLEAMRLVIGRGQPLPCLFSATGSPELTSLSAAGPNIARSSLLPPLRHAAAKASAACSGEGNVLGAAAAAPTEGKAPVAANATDRIRPANRGRRKALAALWFWHRRILGAIPDAISPVCRPAAVGACAAPRRGSGRKPLGANRRRRHPACISRVRLWICTSGPRPNDLKAGGRRGAAGPDRLHLLDGRRRRRARSGMN